MYFFFFVDNPLAVNKQTKITFHLTKKKYEIHWSYNKPGILLRFILYLQTTPIILFNMLIY